MGLGSAIGKRYVPDEINSVGDYNSTRVGVDCVPVPNFSKFHDGISFERFELSSGNLVWWLVRKKSIKVSIF